MQLREAANNATMLKSADIMARRIGVERDRAHEKEVTRTLSKRPRLRHPHGLN